jgi:hypothetical protein
MNRGLHTHMLPKEQPRPRPALCREEGLATLIALIALAIFSLLSFYMAFGAKTELRISDNHESEVQAIFAARAGLTHARELVRGLQYNDLLRGPDGTFNNTAGYLSAARTFAFRNPVPWATARTLNILSPAASLTGLADDGLVNTGKYSTTNGTPLVPLVGIAETAPNPYGAGTITTARYFVKVTDNNGEATELTGDAADNPFIDGDNIIIVRSMGVAQTISQTIAGTVRRNSVAVVEARFRMLTTFDLDAPFVVEGPDVAPSAPNLFNGVPFNIDGGAANPGIGVIDTSPPPADNVSAVDTFKADLTKNQEKNITGIGPNPSIIDITNTILPGSDAEKLKDPAYLLNFVNNIVPAFADSVYQGNQDWSGGSAPNLGSFDYSKPANDPSQNPRVTYVNGDLSVSGTMSGGGLLVVTGKFAGNGRFTFNGLILVIGKGDVDFGGLNIGIHGGLFVANVSAPGGVATFGVPKVTMGGNSDIIIDSNGIDMGVREIAPLQLGYREINSSLDP